MPIDPRRLPKLRGGVGPLSDHELAVLMAMSIRQYGLTLRGLTYGDEELTEPTGPEAERIYRRGRIRATLKVKAGRHRCAARRHNHGCVCVEAALDALTDADLQDVEAARARLKELQKQLHIPRQRLKRWKPEPIKAAGMPPEHAEEPEEAEEPLGEEPLPPQPPQEMPGFEGFRRLPESERDSWWNKEF